MSGPILFDQWHLPAGETHLQAWMTTTNRREEGRLTYQYHKYEAALRRCGTRRRVAIDVGAHVGLWSYWMARDFAFTHAFEPSPTHRACWHLNMRARPNAMLFSYALGASADRVGLVTGPSSSGDTRVDLGELATRDVELRTLDGFDLPIVDFLKIDCEGFEYFVLQGAERTVRRCRPVVMVEQKPGHGTAFGLDDLAAVQFLEQLGAAVVWETSGDYLMVFPPEAS